MELGKLAEWNPWWQDSQTINELKGQPRPAYEEIVDSVKVKEIIILTGVRRAGKSTLMYQMIDQLLKKGVDPKQIFFVNFEDKKLSNDSLDEIYSTYRKELNIDKKAFIFFDEIHRIDGWEFWIRKKYDQKTPDKFVISGSCSYLLKKEYSTLLTGRNISYEIFPLSFEESLAFKGTTIEKANLKKGILLEKTKLIILKQMDEYLKSGGFPEAMFKAENFKTKLLEQYFDDIIYKDIIDRYNLNSQKTKDLALFFITNFTGFISLRNTRNSLGISYDSIKDYLSYYKEAFLFFTAEHFSYSFKEQKTLPSKIYCIDNGLRNAVSFKFSKDEGKLAENTVFIELKRRHKDVYYWKNNCEVDFIIKNSDQTLSAINVTYTDEINKRETDALIEFKEKFKKTKEVILVTKNTEKIENKIRFVPLWKWLLNEEKQ